MYIEISQTVLQRNVFNKHWPNTVEEQQSYDNTRFVTIYRTPSSVSTLDAAEFCSSRSQDKVVNTIIE